jgi:hypothetical protein
MIFSCNFLKTPTLCASRSYGGKYSAVWRSDATKIGFSGGGDADGETEDDNEGFGEFTAEARSTPRKEFGNIPNSANSEPSG